MKKGGRSAKSPTKHNSQKITSFFKRQPLPSTSKCNQNILVSSDEEIIEGTPEKPKKILKEVTNHGKSPPHSTPIANKKRKIAKISPQNIPDVDLSVSILKKPCVERTDLKIVSLANVTMDEFQQIQSQLEQKAEKAESHIFCSPSKAKKSITPSKRGQTTPRSKGKRTPIKLFEKSPNPKDFKVEILQNFIIISPSKSDKQGSAKKNHDITPTKSELLNNRWSSAQKSNETTPVSSCNSNGAPRVTPSSKVKAKLDFTLSKTQTTKISPKINIKDLKMENDEPLFDDSWEDDLECLTLNSLDLTKLQHCKIISISSSNVQQIITVQSTKTDETATCSLKEFWFNMKLKENDIIYLSAHKNNLTEWTIDNSHGLLIFEPDVLMSSTAVAGASFCMRQTVLQERYGGFDPSNKAMVVGTLVHSLLQTCLRNGLDNEVAIKSEIDRLLEQRETVESLYESDLASDEIRSEMQQYINEVIIFQHRYLTQKINKRTRRINPGNWKGSIDGIHDIEENIWCNELGIKGRIDISVESEGVISPLELKTGRSSMSLAHRGQVILYIMMMNKLGYKTKKGLLLYLKDGTLRDIPMTHSEERDLIMLRNQLVYYLTRRPIAIKSNNSSEIGNSRFSISDPLLPAELPEPIKAAKACRTCPYNLICCASLKKDNFNLEEFKLLNEVQGDLLAHLKPSHIDYFMHWSALIQLEMTYSEGKSIKDIYTKSPEVREQEGKCLAYMRIVNGVNECNGLYSTVFEKIDAVDGVPHTIVGWNLLACGIGEGRYLVVSTNGRPAVAAGFVTYIDYKSIAVELDRDLSAKFKNEAFHLDTYDSQYGSTFLMANLGLMLENTERAEKLRRLIIDKEAPTFNKTLSGEASEIAQKLLKGKNRKQQRAVIKALVTNDYLLIKGMPGTGKTATIVSLIICLVGLKQSVLLTSHTNSAVDNVCERLQYCGVNVLRLGSESRIHSSLKTRSEHYLTKDCKTPEDFARVYNSANVIAVTCLGSKHPILSKRMMDVCIVDESTQVLQCSLFRALNASKRFILIGDPDQLPPIVRNKEALARGMSESLFERLQDNENATITLQLNYRMNSPITALANKLTYKGQLLIGTNDVANANMRLPKVEAIEAMYKDKEWVLQILDVDLNNAVCVVDTGPIWKSQVNVEMVDENSTCSNIAETSVVRVLVQALLKAGIGEESIGVMAPYRAQVAQIASALHDTKVDVNTVDQFQGKDKEVVIYSCTKSRDVTKPRKVSKNEILEDQRRLTVAVTRAKHKFILIADVLTLREYTPFAILFKSINYESYVKLVDNTAGFAWDDIIKDCEVNLINK